MGVPLTAIDCFTFFLPINTTFTCTNHLNLLKADWLFQSQQVSELCTVSPSFFLLHIQCESKKSPWRLVAIFPKWLGIFQPNFTRLLRIPIYARLRIFIQLSATLTKLCHIKRDHPVESIRAKCSLSAETHAGIFWHFPQTDRNFQSKFYMPIKRSYVR